MTRHIFGFVILSVFAASAAVAADACPRGYVAVNVPDTVIKIVPENECPKGYAQYKSATNCNTGAAFCADFSDELCTQKIKTSGGAIFNLYKTKTTSPSLAVRMTSGDVCYGNLTPGTGAGINVNFRGFKYHMTE